MASSEDRQVAELLRAIATAIENGVDLTSIALDLAGRHSTETKSVRSDIAQKRIAEIIQLLQRSKTREEAISIIRNQKLARRDLIEIARFCSAHVTKDDKVSRIEEKLVEAIVGSRLNSEAIRGSQSADNPRFIAINARITSQINAKIFSALAHHRYRFVFNPDNGGSKIISSKANGEIGEGQNANEHRWRVTDTHLEILNNRDQIYSRFYLLPDGSFQHTNDSDTRSIKGQFLEPLGC